MKKLILFFFFIYTLSCLAYEQDSTEIVEIDSTETNEYNYGILTSLGVGYHDFCLLLSPYGTCDHTDYDTGIAGYAGIEFPFEKNMYVTFELSVFAINAENLHNSYGMENFDYNRILINPSVGINAYPLSIKSKIRPSIHLGFFGIPYYGLDLGLATDLYIYNNFSLQISYKFLFFSKGFFRTNYNNLLYPEIVYLSVKYLIKI